MGVCDCLVLGVRAVYGLCVAFRVCFSINAKGRGVPGCGLFGRVLFVGRVWGCSGYEKTPKPVKAQGFAQVFGVIGSGV